MSAEVYEFQGRQVTLPCIVRDASSANAIYLVPAGAAQQLVPGDAFEVVEAAPGQTHATLGVIDYRDNDLGDYNEALISFSVKPRGAADSDAGTFIYQLPVDQSFTCEAGCAIWGFPKSVQRVDVVTRDDAVRGRLEMDGRHVFTLCVPRAGAEVPAEGETERFTYTYIGGVPHATVFGTGGASTVNPGGAGVTLDLGDHPIADELRGLGLDRATPVLSAWIEHMSGTFGPARKLE